jgi:hypothetical protein
VFGAPGSPPAPISATAIATAPPKATKRTKKARLSLNEEAVAPLTKRQRAPKVLWSRAAATAPVPVKKASPEKPLSTFRKGKPSEFLPIKVTLKQYQRIPEKHRHLYEVVYPSDDSDNSDSDQVASFSSSSPEAHQNASRRLVPEAGARSELNQGQSNLERQLFSTALVIRPSAGEGACLFHSLAQGLAHILDTDADAFNRNASRSARDAIQALTDASIMREAICDHLSGPFSDVKLACLSGQSPRQAVEADYVDAKAPLFDFDWTPPAGVLPVPTAQSITSYRGYVEAMRKKGACGDEICMAASADLLGLRHIVFDSRRVHGGSLDGLHEVSLSLDHHPEIIKTAPSRSTRPLADDGNQQRVLSSRMPLIILRDGFHFEWMHCQSDLWNSPIEIRDDAFEFVVVQLHERIPEIFNPKGFSAPEENSHGTVKRFLPTPGDRCRPFPCEAIMKAEIRRRHKRDLIEHMVEELGFSEETVLAAVKCFEHDMSFARYGRVTNHASLHFLPELQMICKALSNDLDPLSSKTVAPATPGRSEHRSRVAGKSDYPYSKFLSPPSARRTVPMTGPHPERYEPGQLGTFKVKEPVKPVATDNPHSDFDAAVSALMVCANVSKIISTQAIQEQMRLHEGAPLLTDVLRAAWQDLQTKQTLREAAAANLEQPAPLGGVPAITELAESRAQFIATQLGNNSRAMTAQEIITASKNHPMESFAGETAEAVPPNLEKYWQHHLRQIQLTPRGNQPYAAYNQRIHRQSCEALHQEACQAAKTASSKLSATAAPLADAQPQLVMPPRVVQPCYDDNSPMYEANDVDPGTTSWRLATPEPGATPASAGHVSAAALRHSAAIAQHVAASHATTAAPSHPQPAVPTLPIHSSPTVRLAYDREQRRSAAAGQNGGSTINIVVDTGVLPANSIIWKQGAEADGAGFNYHAFAGVKAGWEQANADKDKSYHTFKSFIDARFIGTICDYIKIDRASYDRMLDSTLLQLIEERLKPKDSTIYFVKAGALKISSNERDGTLSARYRTFADAFMAIVNEAKDAGTPLQKESIKSFFRNACNSNNLLRMWASAESWTTLQDVHHRIFEKLQSHEAHEIQRTLSAAPVGSMPIGTNASPAAAAPAPAAPVASPAAHPPSTRPPYTLEQRREYQLQQQQNRFNSQQQQLHHQQLQQQQLHQQQQLVLANVVQQSIDNAMQRITNSPIPALSMQPLAPQVNAVLYQQQPQQQPQQFAPASAAPHPGLDSRGPFWHAQGPHLQCRNVPCTSNAFCQGCGIHGHSSADCRRRSTPGWNQSGYFSERYPGSGPLAYQGPPRSAFNQGPAPPALLPAPSVHQPRIAPPPMPVLPQTSPFPTPHRLNLTTRSPAQSHSTVHANASTQSAPTGAPGAA